MRGYNKVILMGNLARDPEVKTTQGGSKSARFTLAVGREWKDRQSGAKKAETEFINCQAWGPTADIVERWVKKGQGVLVEGRLHVYKYQDKQTGADRYGTDIIVETMSMVGGRAEGNGNGGGYPQQGQGSGYPQPSGGNRGGYGGGSNAGAGAAPLDFEQDFPLDFGAYGGPEDKVDIPF